MAERGIVTFAEAVGIDLSAPERPSEALQAFFATPIDEVRRQSPVDRTVFVDLGALSAEQALAPGFSLEAGVIVQQTSDDSLARIIAAKPT